MGQIVGGQQQRCPRFDAGFRRGRFFSGQRLAGRDGGDQHDIGLGQSGWRERIPVDLGLARRPFEYRSAAALLADIIRHLIGTYGFAGLSEKNADGNEFYLTADEEA